LKCGLAQKSLVPRKLRDNRPKSCSKAEYRFAETAAWEGASTKINLFIRLNTLPFSSKLPELQDRPPCSLYFDVARAAQHGFVLRFLYLYIFMSKSL
jgi:hypothetical protein